MILQIITLLAPILTKIFPDPVERERIQKELTLGALENEKEYVKAITSVVIAEAQGESWMQRNWRPCFSFMLMGLWLWSFILRPLAVAAYGVDIEAVPASELTFLTSIWASAYGIGRSFEKTGSSLKIGA